MAQPTNPLIVWASDDVILPNAQRPNKSLPSESLIQTGYDLSQKPAADEFNYILNNYGEYIKYLVEEKVTEFLEKNQNLNDLPSKSTARTNLDVFSKSEVNNKQINTGNGLVGGGDLSTNRTISMATPSTVGAGSSNSVTSGSHTHSLALTSDNIAILVGVILDGGTIPLPAGFTEAQCRWIVSPNNILMTDPNTPYTYRMTCTVTGRVVTVHGSTDDGTGINPGSANYMIIGVK